MCGIGGVFSKTGKDVYPVLLDLLFSQRHRGSDGFGISVGGKTVKSEKIAALQGSFLSGHFGICHSLLSVTGYQIQPIEFPGKKTSLAHNGQIYNFREIGGADLSNDSESIPLFLSGNIGKKLALFMKKAAGSFACGISDKNHLLAFRDPVGIKPLWFGENSEIFAFASEPSALKKLNINFPLPLLPGHSVKISKKGVFGKKVFDLNDFKKTVPKKSTIESLHDSFLRAVDFRTSGQKKCGVFFSGGVDSSVIAKAVSGRVSETVLFTAGLAGSDDIVFADKAAGMLGLRLVACEIQKDELPGLSLQVLSALGHFDLMQLGIALPIFVCAREAKKHGLKVVFSGQGSDEIFCGYSSCQKALESGGEKAVQAQIWAALSQMWSRNLFREDIVSMHFSLEHRLPFLDLGFLRQAMALPVSEKILSPDDNLRKHAVRKIAAKLGLPNEITERQKKAVQYGSGVQKEIAKLF